MNQQNFARRVGFGALAGLTATAPMTVAMELYRHIVPPVDSDPFIPRQVAEGIAQLANLERHVDNFGEAGWWALTAASHFTFGGIAGALYGLVNRGNSAVFSSIPSARQASPPARKIAQGAGFGLLIWAAHYLGLFPALGILKPTARRPIRKHAGLILSHLVWGITTSLVFEFLMHRAQKCPHSNPQRP